MFRTVNKVKCLNERRCYVLADVIIFVYEVPCIFWHYINVYEVIKLNHSQKIITKWDGIITNCDSLVYYKVRWTVVRNCDTFFITKCDTVYYKLRQVLQSAMDLLQIVTGITTCDDYYKLRQCSWCYLPAWYGFMCFVLPILLKLHS